MRTWGFYLVTLLFLFLLNCGSENSKAGENSEKDTTKAGIETDQKQKPDGPGNMNTSEANVVPIEVTPIIRGEIASYLLYNSTLETEEMADVYSRIPGLIEEIFVEEGSQVRKNQPLIQIEQDEYYLEEQKAKLEYEKQMSEFARFEALKEKNLISVEEFETARLLVRQSELQWKQAKLNLDYTTVRSPINGVVGERLVRLGDRIQTSSRLFVVSNPREKVVKLFVPQDELPKCYLNQAAFISTDVLPESDFKGWVKRISPIVDPTSGTFKVTAGVRDPENLLRPGMFVRVQLIVDIRENTLLIPKAALIYENEKSYFFVVLEDTVSRLELRKGFEDAEKVEVLNNVSDTSKVVVVGQSGLKQGNTIKIVNEKYFQWQNVGESPLSMVFSIKKRNEENLF